MALVTVRYDASKARRAFRKGAADGLTDAMEHLLTTSRRRVPIEEGTLERSGRKSVDRGALRGAVGYGGPYARRQHEELTWRHDPGRTAKYLEGPFVSGTAIMLALIAAGVRREMGG